MKSARLSTTARLAGNDDEEDVDRCCFCCLLPCTFWRPSNPLSRSSNDRRGAGDDSDDVEDGVADVGLPGEAVVAVAAAAAADVLRRVEDGDTAADPFCLDRSLWRPPPWLVAVGDAADG